MGIGSSSGLVKDTLGRRILRARLELSVRGTQKVTQERLGQLVAEHTERAQRITGATVSRWESGESTPDIQTLEAIAVVCSVDPGWLAFGEKSRAPSPTADARTLSGRVAHERRILEAEHSMRVEDLIRRTAEADHERTNRLVAELRALGTDESRDATRKAKRIMRDLDAPSLVERLHQSLFGDEAEHERRLEHDREYRRRWYGEDDEDENGGEEGEPGDDGGRTDKAGG